jgi:hypothetical protein
MFTGFNEIIGAVVGAIVGGVLTFAVAWIIFRKQEKKQDEGDYERTFDFLRVTAKSNETRIGHHDQRIAQLEKDVKDMDKDMKKEFACLKKDVEFSISGIRNEVLGKIESMSEKNDLQHSAITSTLVTVNTNVTALTTMVNDYTEIVKKKLL